MDQNRQEKKTLLGFLALHTTLNEDGYLGAILVTDNQGIPQEFRCSLPVKPTTIQRPLYGERLGPYIGVKLCGIPLIESIQIKPSLIVVNKDFLVEVRVACHYPLVFLSRAGEAIDINSSDSEDTKVRKERIDCSSGRFQPIIVSPHPNFHDDISEAREILEDIFNYLDPLEPFERIRSAIEIIGKRDQRFQ